LSIGSLLGGKRVIAGTNFDLAKGNLGLLKTLQCRRLYRQ
jgi:hypothetical protein